MFTFRTEQPTGRYRSFFDPIHYIKFKQRVVGSIGDELPHKIRLMVIKEDINEDKNPNCEWKWITLNKKSASVDEAKQFLKENYEAITTKYNIRQGA